MVAGITLPHGHRVRRAGCVHFQKQTSRRPSRVRDHSSAASVSQPLDTRSPSIACPAVRRMRRRSRPRHCPSSAQPPAARRNQRSAIERPGSLRLPANETRNYLPTVAARLNPLPNRVRFPAFSCATLRDGLFKQIARKPCIHAVSRVIEEVGWAGLEPATNALEGHRAREED